MDHHQKAIDCWKQGALTEAEKRLRLHLDSFTNDASAIANMGSIYRDRGDFQEAIDLYNQSLKLQPDQDWVVSNRLMTLNYSEHFDRESIKVEHEKVFLEKISPGKIEFKNSLNADKKIHIGFVSGDLRWHSVAFFLLGLLRHLPKSEFEVTCFSDSPDPDNMSHILKQNVEGWVDSSTMSDEKLIQTLRRSRVDVLFDLAGHTARNRAMCFYQRCAPVQVSWLGYPTRTGNPSIDYWMTDSIICSNEDKQYGFEKPLRLDVGAHVYFPPVSGEDVSTERVQKSSKNETVLGCFNHRAKITKAQLITWADILKELPGSSLILKTRSFADSLECERVLDVFKKQGVSEEKIHLFGRTETTIQHLEYYQRIDIALDTFPYNGTTTTCESIWMGVPVVTQIGTTHASRVGASILGQLGLQENVTNDPAEYHDRVIRLSQEKDFLESFRTHSRSLMWEKGLIDHQRFSKAFAHQIRQVWAEFCESR